MNESATHRTRVELSALVGLLAVGDLAAIGVFVVAGELSHGYELVGDSGRIAGTLAPFLVGWVLVSVAGRLYTRRAIDSLSSAVLRTLFAWAVAVGIAQALRATSVFHGNAAVTFALVSFGVGGVLLVTWRSLLALFT